MGDVTVKGQKVSAEELEAMKAVLTPEQAALLDKLAKSGEGKSRRMSDDEILANRPHVIKDAFVVDGKKVTTRWNPEAKKQEAMIRCTISGCKETRIAFTSDLFQVKTCMTHRKEQRKAAREARVSKRDELIELGKKALAEKAKAEAGE